MILQLASYGWFLVVFVGIASFTAFRWGLGGMLAGHFIIAAIMTVLDLMLLQVAMNAEGWDGTPDMDLFFEIGLLIRIVLMNALLLPVTFVALGIRSSRRVKRERTQS